MLIDYCWQNLTVSPHLTLAVDKFYEWNSAYPSYLHLLSFRQLSYVLPIIL